MRKIIIYFKVIWNWWLRSSYDTATFSWNKTSGRCANASWEDQSTGTYCYLLEKQCHAPKCKHWRDRYR